MFYQHLHRLSEKFDVEQKEGDIPLSPIVSSFICMAYWVSGRAIRSSFVLLSTAEAMWLESKTRNTEKKLCGSLFSCVVIGCDCLVNIQMEIPSQTLYLNNLNEKVKKNVLKKTLYALFSQFGKVIEIVACRGIKLRGQV
jgi:hypothetical protein